MAKKCCQMTLWNNDHCLVTLSAALAEVGDFKAAVERLDEAMRMRPCNDAKGRRQLMQEFKAGMPHRGIIERD